MFFPTIDKANCGSHKAVSCDQGPRAKGSRGAMVTASGHPKGDAPIKTIQEIHKVIFGQFFYLSWQFRRLP